MFGFAPPHQSRMAPIGQQLRPMQQQQPMAPLDPSKFGALPSMGDARAGLSKLGIGGPGPTAPMGLPPGVAPSPQQQAYQGAVMNTTGPVTYAPPPALDTTNMGPVMGSAMAGAPAAGAAAGAGDAAAGLGDAAASGGLDIGSILAMIGL